MQGDLLYYDLPAERCQQTFNLTVTSSGIIRAINLTTSVADVRNYGPYRFGIQSLEGTVLSLQSMCLCPDEECNGVDILIDVGAGIQISSWSNEDPPRLIVTSGNHTSVTVRGILHKISITVSIEFTVLPQSQRGHLLTQYMSGSSGVITSLGFDRGLLYPDDVTSWGLIEVPRDKGLMISFTWFHLSMMPLHCLDVYLTDTDGRVKHAQHQCGSSRILAQVYHEVRSATINMTSTWNSEGTGFKLLFSFHRIDELPQKLPNGLFNCSTEDYSSFRQHLDCNLEQECQDGDDETGQCPFSSEQCQGQVASGNKCFFMLTMDAAALLKETVEGNSWNLAPVKCEENNGHLASFATPQEWTDVLTFWQYSKVLTQNVFIGLKLKWNDEPFMYRYMFKWADRALVYFMPQLSKNTRVMIGIHSCTIGRIILHKKQMEIRTINCQDLTTGGTPLCERTLEFNAMDPKYENSPIGSEWEKSPQVVSTPFQVSNTTWAVSRLCDSTRSYTLAVCPCGHVTHSFLSCDPGSHCGEERYVDECPVQSPALCYTRLQRRYEHYTHVRGSSVRTNTSHSQRLQENLCTSNLDNGMISQLTQSVLMFVCNNEATVHYTLVCDFRPDCLDGSDETFCSHPACWEFRCRNGQCVPTSRRCDGISHCLDNADEQGCQERDNLSIPKHAPGLINFDGKGGFIASEFSKSQPCPQTHYRCPSEPRYCLPIYTRCNGYYDCVGREDENQCDDVSCPGLYRCRDSSVCVHVDHLCDGWSQCPHRDDERLCQAMVCPEVCLCQGSAFICDGSFSSADHPDLRYLEMKSVPVTLSSFSQGVYIIYLSIIGCDVSILPANISLPNLQILDLSRNKISTLNMSIVHALPNIKVLRLADNPVSSLITAEHGHISSVLQAMDLSTTLLETFESQDFASFSKLRELNLSHSKVCTIGQSGFKYFPALEELDLRGCPLKHFHLDMFSGLTHLTIIQSPNYRVCCERIIPQQSTNPTCLAPDDPISTCENMLSSRSYQVILFIVTIVAVVGNCACMIARYVIFKDPFLSSYGLLVSNTNVANLLLGVSTGIVVVADELYRGQYVLYENQWTESATCSAAGLIHLLSHQVSLLNMLVISLDRIIVLHFPTTTVRLQVIPAAGVCLLTWTVGVVVAVLPGLRPMSSWEFYKQSALCFPSPVPNNPYPGDHVHFGVLVVQTLVVSVLILVSQAFIVIRLKRRRFNCLSRESQDAVLACQFYRTALVNALCWFAVSLYSLVCSFRGTGGGSQLYVVLMSLLPAALFPLTLILRRRQEDTRRKTEARLLAVLQTRALQRKAGYKLRQV